jgi:DNA-binding transcriptional ArsR family regulator
MKLPREAVEAKAGANGAKVLAVLWRHGEEQPGGEIAICRATHDEVAEACGVSRSTAQRALRDLRDVGLVAATFVRGVIETRARPTASGDFEVGQSALPRFTAAEGRWRRRTVGQGKGGGAPRGNKNRKGGGRLLLLLDTGPDGLPWNDRRGG